MLILSSSDRRQQGFTTYLGPLKKKIAAQNSYTSLSARNSQKLCSLQSQLAKAAKKKKTSNKHMVATWLQTYFLIGFQVL